MPNSSPSPSSVVAKAKASNAVRGDLGAGHTRSVRRKFSIKLAALFRWLHIYLSMFGLAAVLFFSATGVTLNHPDWFYGEAGKTVETKGDLPPAWVIGKTSATEGDPAAGVSKLEIVEKLRQAHGIKGALVEFRVDDAECMVTFKGPGYSGDAFIDRETGKYTLTQTFHGLIAILNDLHKGRDTGKVWSVVIDISAIFLVVLSLTGLVLLLYLKRRRMSGLVVGLLGAAVIALAGYYFVP